MANNTASKIYQQLISQQEDEILQGMEATQAYGLVDEVKIRTALICLAHFSPNIIKKVAALPNYLLEVKEGKTNHKSLSNLLNYMAHHTELKYHYATVRLFIGQHCHRLRKIRLTSVSTFTIAKHCITPETLPLLESITLIGSKNFPAFLFAFPQLKHLALTKGTFRKIPKKIGEFEALETLNLSDNLINQLPKYISTFAQLHTLNLSSNKLEQLPESISKLERLHTLDLSDNRINQLPESIGKLERLHTLDLSNNKFTELPESIGKLKQLHTLDLSNNRFTELPESISKLKQLYTLNLSSNQLEQLPESFGKLEQLHTLNLSNNRLEQLPESIGKLKQLHTLDLSHNKLRQLPESIGKLPQLQQIDVNFNFLITLPRGLARPQVTLKGWANPYIKITKKEAQIFAKEYKERKNKSGYTLNQRRSFAFFLFVFGQQYDIDLRVTVELAEELKISNEYNLFEKLLLFDFILYKYRFEIRKSDEHNWRFLKSNLLNAHVTEINQREPFKKIKQLIPDFSCTITNIPEDTLLAMSASSGKALLKFTEEVPLDYNNDLQFLEGWVHPTLLTDIELNEKELKEIPQWLKKYTQLKTLNLDSNHFTNIPLNFFHQLTKLTHLSLASNQLEELPNGWQVSLQQLSYLNLSYNQLTTLPADWDLPALKTLHLQGNQLKEVNPHIFKAKNLEYLDLYLTHLTDLPTEGWEQLQNIETLDLTNNYLIELPEGLLRLPSLENLLMSYNQLTNLPTEGWEQLQNIETLDLTNNYLIELPEGLLHLPTLHRLLVANNQLSHLPEALVNKGVFEISDFVHNHCDIPLSMKEAYLAYLGNVQDDLWRKPTFTNLFCISKFNADKDIRNATTEKLKTCISEEGWAVLEEFPYQSKPDYVQWLVLLQKYEETLSEHIDQQGVEIWTARQPFQKTKRVLLGGLGLRFLPDFALNNWQNPWVDLSHNELKELPQSLENILDVSRIDLSFNLLENLSEQNVWSITQVKLLNLSNNFLNHLDDALFAELPRVVHIDLSHNHLKELPTMSYAPKLKKLDLSHNLLSTVPASLTRLENLQSLNLSYNHLGYKIWRDEYPLPLEISHLERLTHLDLSYNFLTLLPTGIGLIDELQWLNLSHNKLAHVPIGIYDSMTLEVLDLSYNALVHLPAEMAVVDTLQKLVLTGNPLPYYEVVKLQELMPQTTIIFEKEAPAPYWVAKGDLQVDEGLENEAVAMYETGKNYHKQERDIKALYWWRKAANLGHVVAQKTLGEYYDKMDDLAKARHWYGKAAAQGSNRAAKNYKKLFR